MRLEFGFRLWPCGMRGAKGQNMTISLTDPCSLSQTQIVKAEFNLEISGS
jgi:hypothetical protein